MLTCYACDHAVESGQRCPDCGEPLWFDTDPEGLSWPDRGGVWAFADLLPVDPPRGGLAAAAGATPLIRAPELDVDGARVHVKLEGTNPTGSFKDRGSAVGVAAAVADGTGTVGTVSHGNMAASMAAHAASADLDCVVLVPADISDSRLDRIAAYGPRIVRVDGDYGRLYHDALDLGPEAGIAFVNSDSPLRVAGQKTTTLEVLRAFAAGEVEEAEGDVNVGDDSGVENPEAASPAATPDAVVMPVSSGGHASAAWKAVREATEAGLVDDPPRLYFVQAAACAPVADAFARGDDAVTRLEAEEVGETVAYSIANPDPPSGTRALSAARDTDGAVLAVDDDAIRAARRDLAAAGMRVEAASATPLAGLRRLRERGAVDAGEHVVLVATGVGYGGTDDGDDGDGDGGDDGAGPADAETVTRERLAAALGVGSTDGE
ncbi:pyridoxal-phosphate dependent enzyme [Halobaculum sp. WSA2]|uniref:Pyridoxal-phosphate dependent enzyme n=1 Tax=Halobaculum saliterrae TaxID=2073113 RepID=A0A6B0SZF7_9EURY|nr:pyridoxal-phosphate dependent enzyme [Halobaculum saliterrae]MXR41953.1 pyridoxal-phosphate dependent enzyme [Halobaculum saliterrae]